MPSSFALPTVLALFSHEIAENKKVITNSNDLIKLLKGKELEFEYKSGTSLKSTKVKIK